MNSNREITIPHRFSNRLSSDSLRRWLGVGLVLLGVVVGLYQIAPRHDQALFSSVPPSTQDVAYPALSVRAADSESASRFVGRAIEEIEVGQRVLAHNPDSRFEGDVLEPEPSPDSCRVVRIVMQKHDGGRLDITLLRSLEWLEGRGATVGSVIELDTSELNACGQALVTAIEPCPEIEGGGRPSRYWHLPPRQLPHRRPANRRP